MLFIDTNFILIQQTTEVLETKILKITTWQIHH